jgi:hypothetical protein
MNRRRLLAGVVVTVAVVVAVGASFVAYMKRERPAYNVSADGIAIGSYDPVSYFPEGGGRPRRGDPAITVVRQGRTYRFASEANKEVFERDPERFEPQFGGWCAYAVANGYKFEVDPESFRLQNGRLLLFYDGIFGDARAAFEKEGAQANLAKADASWPSLAAQNAQR